MARIDEIDPDEQGVTFNLDLSVPYHVQSSYTGDQEMIVILARKTRNFYGHDDALGLCNYTQEEGHQSARSALYDMRGQDAERDHRIYAKFKQHPPGEGEWFMGRMLTHDVGNNGLTIDATWVCDAAPGASCKIVITAGE